MSDGKIFELVLSWFVVLDFSDSLSTYCSQLVREKFCRGSEFHRVLSSWVGAYDKRFGSQELIIAQIFGIGLFVF